MFEVFLEWVQDMLCKFFRHDPITVRGNMCICAYCGKDCDSKGKDV